MELVRESLFINIHHFLLLPVTADRPESISQVIQCCIFPRAKNSSVDALFCAKFINLLHSIGTLNFSTLTLYDKVRFTLFVLPQVT